MFMAEYSKPWVNNIIIEPQIKLIFVCIVVCVMVYFVKQVSPFFRKWLLSESSTESIW